MSAKGRVLFVFDVITSVLVCSMTPLLALA